METGLKQRIVGAAVLVILAVIFIPMLLDTSVEEKQFMGATNIPVQPANMPTPETEDFSSRIVPLEQPPKQEAESKPADTQVPATVEEGMPPSSDTTVPPGPREPVMENKDEAGGVGVTAWVVQLGSFSSSENAEALNQKLRKAGFKAFVEPLKQDAGTIYRVRIGPELKRSDADKINDQLKKDLQIAGIVVHYP
jgi:DedD protein